MKRNIGAKGRGGGQKGSPRRASISARHGGLAGFIAGMPKATLHTHIEGTLEPELAFELARRNGIKPGSDTFPARSIEELRKAYSFTDLRSFLDLYYTVSRVLMEKRDFRDLARAYCEKAISQNIRHAELFFDPQSHTSRGIPFTAVADGLNEAFAEARGEGLSINLIVSILRDSPPGSPGDLGDPARGFESMNEATGWATIKQAVAYNEAVTRPEYRFIGIGLDSNEVGFPPRIFRGIYSYARKHGLLCTAHADEEGPPEYV